MERKIINPCICDVIGGRARAFAKIEFNDGRLSITGAVGPLKSGNRRGSAGQCVNAIREGTPVEGWNREMLDKFCGIWDRWHLNDCRPECEHQRELGWPDLAGQMITLYHYRLTQEASEAKRKAEEAAMNALCNGETFTPTMNQTMYANLPDYLDIYEPLDGKEAARYYEPHMIDFTGYGSFRSTEQKLRGCVRADESELGLLCKPCPVCGYQYGTAWKKEEVPQDVLDWLFALPDTETQPAWV